MNSISILQAFPRVFADEVAMLKQSEVWLCDLRLEKGQHYLIEAESGAGKSSLCSFIYGYRDDYDGHIMIDREDIRYFSRDRWGEIRQAELSILWQELRLFADLSAWDNLIVKNRLTGYKSYRELKGLMERLGIEPWRDQSASKLSLGQQQRLAILRTLCQPFDFLILDEPISHLDDANASIVAQLLAEEAQARGSSIVATSVGKHLPLHYDHTLNL